MDGPAGQIPGKTGEEEGLAGSVPTVSEPGGVGKRSGSKGMSEKKWEKLRER